MLTQCFRLLDLSFHFQQELFHVPGPGLFAFFLDKRELAQVMDIAQGRGERVSLVALQSIMDRDSMEAWRNPNSVQTGASSARMSCVVRQPIGRANVNPPALFANAQAGFAPFAGLGLSPAPL